MKNLDEALLELEHILESELSKHIVPVKSGTTIRIGPMIVRKSKAAGYIVIDSKNSKQIENTFSKTAAIAVAKSYIKNKNYKHILKYDNVLEKNFNDITFYYNIISNTDDETRKEAVSTRLEIAQDKIDNAKYILEDYILRDV